MSTKNTPDVSSNADLATEAQLGHIFDMWRRRLKNRGLTNAEAQKVVTNGGIYLPVMDKAVDVLVDRVRSDVSNTIVRTVRVVRNRTRHQVIDATGRQRYVDATVLATMPTEGDEEVEMEFFPLGRFASNEEVAAELDSRDLDLDPVALAAVNEADPAFADTYPNGINWKLQGGGWGFMLFNRGDHERYVLVDRRDLGWNGSWWLGGRRKKVLGS